MGTVDSISIRRATADDAQRIHDLHTSAVRTECARQYPPEIIDGWLANRSPQGYLRGIDSGAIFVAEVNADVVGFGEAISGQVVAVFVDPAFGRRGVGAALLDHAIRLARAEADGSVRLESTLNAVGFYERYGFVQLERSMVRRNHVEVPVVLMQRNDG